MSTDLVKASENAITPIDQLPDYLKGNEASGGLENLDGSDYVVPRVKLLQSNSPEILKFAGVAIPGCYWHTGANVNLGKEINVIITYANKRVVLWSARNNNNATMLAFSADGKTWAMGGNSTFEIENKRRAKVKVSTGKDVVSSKLTEWGSSDPSDSKSAPAATQIYEYVIDLVDNPGISPCVFGMYRTMAANAKALNTQLLMLKQQRRPITSVAIKIGAEIETADGNSWFVPNFKLAGNVSKERFERANGIQESYSRTVASRPHTVEEATKQTIIDDEIPF
jgi:hypothetical protein